MKNRYKNNDLENSTSNIKHDEDDDIVLDVNSNISSDSHDCNQNIVELNPIEMSISVDEISNSSSSVDQDFFEEEDHIKRLQEKHNKESKKINKLRSVYSLMAALTFPDENSGILGSTYIKKHQDWKNHQSDSQKKSALEKAEEKRKRKAEKRLRSHKHIKQN